MILYLLHIYDFSPILINKVFTMFKKIIIKIKLMYSLPTWMMPIIMISFCCAIIIVASSAVWHNFHCSHKKTNEIRQKLFNKKYLQCRDDMAMVTG